MSEHNVEHPKYAGYLAAKEKLDGHRLKQIEAAHSKNTRTCLECAASIPYKKRHSNKYCNQRCAALFNNRIRRNRQLVVYVCPGCNQDKHKLSKSKQKCCSKKCANTFKRREKIDLIQKQGHYASAVVDARTMRGFLIEVHGAKCMDCGWCSINPKSQLCPIELEHIDGDSTNNNLSNLKLLCPNCHSLTPTYKALNIGNGRHKRRIRYNEGKSY